MIKNKIIDEIQKRNCGISLEKFIDICLFDNEGYYEISNPLGKSGDFITSPEISQLFGEILGLYIHSLWHNKYKEKFNLIELGPGNGTLLIDILRITKPLVNFHNFLNIHLIEKNKYLINKQKQNLRLSKFDNINIRWHNDFINIDQRPSIIYANEFFDCLPIRQFINKSVKREVKSEVTQVTTYNKENFPGFFPADSIKMRRGNILSVYDQSKELKGRLVYNPRSDRLELYDGNPGDRTSLTGKLLENPNLDESFRVRSHMYFKDWASPSRYESLVHKFEKKVSGIVKAKYAVATNSATSALHIACLALNLKKDTKSIKIDLWFRKFQKQKI